MWFLINQNQIGFNLNTGIHHKFDANKLSGFKGVSQGFLRHDMELSDKGVLISKNSGNFRNIRKIITFLQYQREIPVKFQSRILKFLGLSGYSAKSNYRFKFLVYIADNIFRAPMHRSCSHRKAGNRFDRVKIWMKI